MSDKDVDGRTREVPAFANLVFKEATVGFLYILRQVGIEHEGWNLRVGQLGAVLDLDVFALDGRGRIGFDEREHLFVQLGGRHAAFA